MKTLNIFTIIIIGFATVSCGSQKNINPVWVENPRDHYDENKYMLAVGSGNTLTEATNDAFASLSRIFQMDINATEQLEDVWIERSRNNSEVFSESTTKLLNNIQIGTNQELMNTSILVSETGANGVYYAIAGMDRRESAQIYDQEITNNKFKIDDLEESADNEKNVLQKLILLKKARILATVNENLSKQLNIIQGGAANTEFTSQTVSRIEEKFRRAQQSAIITITSDNATNTIISAVADVFQKAGFNVTENSGSEVLEVKINFDTQKAELNRDDAEFVKWELVINVLNKNTNQSFNTFMAEGRDGALSYQDALKRADFNARKNIGNQFYSFLNQELLSTK